MRRLASALVELLRQAMEARLGRGTARRVQLVFVGPPVAVLEAMFEQMTSGGIADWSVRHPGTGKSERVVVLLVKRQTGYNGRRGSALSQRCNWDYAVSVRNSEPFCVILVAPAAWDSRHESIANATETIGCPRMEETTLAENEPWPFLVGLLSRNLSIEEETARQVFSFVLEDSGGLGPGEREGVPWVVADALLGAASPDDLILSVGLPSLGTRQLTGDNLERARDVLKRLAELCEEKGLAEAEALLRNRGASLLREDRQLRPLARPLRELFRCLRNSCGTGSAFARCPTWYLRESTKDSPSWWRELPFDKLGMLLDAAGPREPAGGLTVRCVNAVYRDDGRGGSWVVEKDVKLEARDKSGNVPGDVEFYRQVGRGAATLVARAPDGNYTDDFPPAHDRPITYRAESPRLKPASIKVISLRSFGCPGYAVIKDAVSSFPPSRSRASNSFEQEIVVAAAGTHGLVVYTAGPAAVSVLRGDGTLLANGSSGQMFPLDLEDGDEVTVVVRDPGGQELGKWTVRVLVREADGDLPRTRFEALLRAHQKKDGRVEPVSPRDSGVRRIEDLYLASPDGWKGVVACWSGPGKGLGRLELASGVLGNVPVPADPRPDWSNVEPPSGYLSARERIREKLLGTCRTIGEADLSADGLPGLVEEYLDAYLEWFSRAPEVATWVDCIAVHAPEWNLQAGQEMASVEPVALLLSPLHPLRLAWQCHAQEVLEKALELGRCPVAGILDPHASPAILALPLYRGGHLVIWRAFLATRCNEPHWSLLWNQQYLGSSGEQRSVALVLEWLGFEATGLTGGFTRSQVVRSLNELVSILPARATFRVGIVGEQESPGCTRGIVDWCRKELGTDRSRDTGLPNSCEVYSLGHNVLAGSAVTITTLSEETGERVRWFSPTGARVEGRMDLVILDQLGMLAPRGDVAKTRSPLAPGVLFRVVVREDIGHPLVIRESRIGKQEANFPGLAGKLVKATVAIEEKAGDCGKVSHLLYSPNQEAINRWLDSSLFVAATSSQVDPACLARGTAAYSGYLWDYELPMVQGTSDQPLGYYLVARPTEAMKRAIADTVGLVANPATVPVEPLLGEISRRGIPVLKKMASGGNFSRGELGVLLAVRWLQDAFRQPNTGVRLPAWNGACVHLILPVDSYWNSFDQLQEVLDPDAGQQRPDLLVFAIRVGSKGPVRIKVTPVEVKLREQAMLPAEMLQALGQAANLGRLLHRLWVNPPGCDLWFTCARALLCQCLDHGFRVYADPAVHGLDNRVWAEIHEETLRQVLAGSASVVVSTAGRLAVFDRSDDSSVIDLDGDGMPDTVVFCRADAEYLLAGTGRLSPGAENAVTLLDFSYPECACEQGLLPGEPADSGSRDGVVQVAAGNETPGDFAGKDGESGESDSRSHHVCLGDSPLPSHLRQRVNAAFDGFIGNELVVKRVKNDVLRALMEDPPYLSRNYLFTGQPSTGKTELARRVAQALGLPFVRVDGRAVTTRERLFELIKGHLIHLGHRPSHVGHQVGLPVMEYPPLIVFVDEVHLVPRTVQESLLTMLEAADRTVTLPGNHVAKMNKATFLFATTRASDLDPAFRSRCVEVELREYDAGEVAEILARRFPRGWPQDIYIQIARLGRCVPRVALELARELETEITVSERPERSLYEHLDEVRKASGIDRNGLTRLDLHYLEILASENRPLGEQAIARMMGTVDKDRVVDEIEPFLKRLGLIRFGPQGREITPRGKEYLSRRQNHDLEP